MPQIFKPESEDQLIEIVRWAAGEEEPLELIGHASKRGLGRPVDAGHVLDMSLFSGIKMYEPEELVMTVGAGTPMTEIESALAQHDQMLAFEPADYGPLLGGVAEAGTIGGVVATGAAGPRRFKAGATRDHVLGVRGVSGRGEAFKTGGRVVKNVTGYDLSKLMTGSYGTLAALTEITLKLVPSPEQVYTLLIYGLDDADGCAALRTAASSSHEASGLAHLPRSAAGRSAVGRIAEPGRAVTALRVEGAAVSVAHRMDALRALLGDGHQLDELHSHNSRIFWREVGSAGLLAAGEDAHIWRVSIPPSGAAELAGEVAPTARYYDWAGGLIWLAFDKARHENAAALRTAVGRTGGHATLIRAPNDERRELAVFQPQEQALAALSARVKESFDPKGILNPGRMVEGV